LNKAIAFIVFFFLTGLVIILGYCMALIIGLLWQTMGWWLVVIIGICTMGGVIAAIVEDITSRRES
jgi:hypothetical protein